jgi:hypothetical protein
VDSTPSHADALSSRSVTGTCLTLQILVFAPPGVAAYGRGARAQNVELLSAVSVAGVEASE